MSGATFRHITVGSRESLIDVAQVIDVAGIKPVIDRTCDYADARAAFAHLDSGAHFGKVVIRCT
ncbi:zinc-binding dehydrogenase [Pseudomonas syringae]|uniref:zinc-binding dehydrogenase n=1 Tax=Pseudomonas syringae TaxID=317 RepID=UPI0034D3BB6F